jgi:hypothetical protein
VNADDHDNDKHADPEHNTLNRKKSRPENSNERDQVKHDPGSNFRDLHVDQLLIDQLIKYLQKTIPES